MRRAHAVSPDQMEPINEWTGLGWFDLDDVAFGAEARRVVVPFRLLDEEAGVVEAPRTLRDLLHRRRLRVAPGDGGVW
jgi:hypothetical protein